MSLHPRLHPLVSGLVALLGLAAPATASTADLLLVVVDPGALTTQEAAKKSLFESWNYTVNLIDVNDGQTSFDSAVAANDLAYITEDVNSGDLNTKMKSAPIGIVWEEANLMDDFGLATGLSWGPPQTVITIDTNSHFITATFSTGALTIYTTAESTPVLAAPFGGGFQTLASWSGGPSLGVIDAGGALNGGGTAAGRRVELPWGGNDFDINHLNADGLTLLRRSLIWAHGRVSHWKLDETSGTLAADSISGHDGTVTSGSWTTGRVNGCLSADGTNTYVSIPNHPDFQVTNALTMAAWIKADVWGTGYDVDVILRKGEGNPNNWQFAIVDGQVSLILDANDTSGIKGATVLNTGEWYHVAATWDGSNVRIYVNGALDVGPVSRTGTIGIDTRPVYIAGRAGADLLDGIIDEVGMYSRALSASEIAELAAITATRQMLMVVVDPASLTAQESAHRSRFGQWGYNVNLIDESDSQANFDAAVGVNDIAYIPEEVSSSNVGTKLVDAPIGVVIEERACFDEFGLTATTAGAWTETTISIRNYDHYITKQFAAGDLTICSTSQPMNAVTQSIPRGGQVLADWPFAGRALIAIDAGGGLTNGGRAKGRRVFLPVGDGAFDWNALNANGLALVERSMDWAGALMAHWTLDETSGTTAADAVGGYNATLTSMDQYTDWVNGRVRGGLDFDGVNDRAPTTGPLEPPAEGTVAFWMKVPGPPTAHGRIFGISDTWEVRHVTDGTADGIPYGLVFDIGWSGVNTTFVTTTPLDVANKWYFVAATYSTTDSTYAVYLDGVLHKSGAATLAVPAAGILTFGTRTGSSNYFRGQLDDLRISNKQMGADEIASLHAQAGVRLIGWSEVDPH